jgi:hypothetical protein
MADLSDDNVLATVSVRPSPLLFWLTVDLRVSEKSISGKQPNTVLGIIPAGYKKVSYALKQVSGVDVETKVSVSKILLGALVFFAGVMAFSSNLFLGLLLAILGAALFVAGLTAALAITNTGGATQYITVSLLDRAKLEEFASVTQKAVLDVN